MHWIRVLAMLLTCVSALVGCRQRELLSPARFTQHFAKQLGQAIPDRTVTVLRDLELRTSTREGHETRVFLDNAYNEFKRDPASIDVIVTRFVASAMETVVTGGSLV